MVRRFVLVAACWVAAVAICAGQVAMPLRIVFVSYDPASQMVEFTLRNDSPQVVTAWNVRARLIAPDGSAYPSSGVGSDSYLSAAGLTSEGAHINPGDVLTRHLKASISSRFTGDRALLDASLEVTLAILADGSAFGEPKDIAFVFERREDAYKTWGAIVGILERVQQQSRGVEGLRLAEELVAKLASADHQNMVRDGALQNIRLAIADVERRQADPDSRLQTLHENARRQLSAAATHRRRTAEPRR